MMTVIIRYATHTQPQVLHFGVCGFYTEGDGDGDDVDASRRTTGAGHCPLRLSYDHEAHQLGDERHTVCLSLVKLD